MESPLSVGVPRPRPAAESDALDGPEFLSRLRSGDESAFESLVRGYGGRMLAVSRRFVRNEEDARDAVQDAFLSAFRSLGAFHGESQLSTWLHRIVVNAALMKLRTRRRKPSESIEELLPRFDEDGGMERPARPWKDGAHRLLEQREERQRVRNAIDRLPDDYRNVLLLRDIEEIDTEQTAELLGISKGAVKTRLHRARLALRGQLDPHLRRSAE